MALGRDLTIQALHSQITQALKARDKEAAVWVQRALDANPQFAQAYNTLGVIADRLGNKAESLRAFQQSIKLFPDDPEVLRLNPNIAGLTMLYPGCEPWKRQIQTLPF